MKEGSVSVLKSEKVIGDTTVGSESQVKLGRTFHPVKIAAIGMCAYAKYVKCMCVCVVCSHTCKLVCKCADPDTGTREEMEILEEKFVDGEYSPFDVGEGCPPTSRRSCSPGMKQHDFEIILKCKCDFYLSEKENQKRKKGIKRDAGLS